MVVVEEVTKLSERRTQTSSEAFPDDALASIRAAVEAVPDDVFDGSIPKGPQMGNRSADYHAGGGEEDIMSVYRKRNEVGSDRGPHYPTRPDRLFKRSVRGMLPYKTTRGRDAFENVRIYLGNPYEDDDGVESDVLEGTSLDRLSNIKFVSLGSISENLGANVTW